MIRVGIDVGGTFTDLVCLNEASGQIAAVKVPSTSGHEHKGFLEGLQALGVGGKFDQIVHGTTVATNALLQHKGGRVAMLCTRGFRDVIEIGRCMRYAHGSLFDTKFVKPAPLVPRHCRFEVSERMAADGTVLTALDTADLKTAIDEIKGENPESVAICLLNAYANDDHEKKVRSEIQKAFPNAHICTSVEVHRGHQEFERFATTALNAFLMPPVAQYLLLLETTLRESGIQAPILIMSSSGGTLSPASAARLPVRTILSGPVGGVAAAVDLAETVGLDDIITYDMGGTSTDVCVIRGRQPITTDQVIFGGLPVRGMMLEINTVGAGAGSIAYRDIDGALSVGPESAGAVPGPVAYGAGGTQPTVTDANLVLGRLNPDRALGGRIRLDSALAEASLRQLSERTGSLSVHELAEGIVRIAVAKMAGAIREVSVSRGLDPRRFALVAYGGAGPMHAAFVAEELGIKRVIVPQLPGNFSAVGLLTASLKWDAAESLFAALDADSVEKTKAVRKRLSRQVADHLVSEGVDPASITYESFLEMHYVGQASSFSVRLPEGEFDLDELRKLFLAQYEDRYGHANPSRQIAISGIRVIAISQGKRPDLGKLERANGTSAVKETTRQVMFGGKQWACPFVQREHLKPGAAVTGPVLVEESGSMTVVPPGWDLKIDNAMNIHLTRHEKVDE
jgi:N-methylhydantoinase A